MTMTITPTTTRAIGETIANVVALRSDQIFLVDAIGGREITYAQFHALACALAADLQHRGLHKGDRVAVMVPNCCELAILYFACFYLGAVIVPISPSLNKSEVEFIVKSCHPTFVIASETLAEFVRQFHPSVHLFKTTHAVSSTVGDLATIDLNNIDLNNIDLNNIDIDLLPAAPSFVPCQGAHHDDLMLIIYTSGTSAKPKGLAHRIGSMFRNATAFATAQSIDENSRFYLTLSMAYMGGFYNLLLLPFLCGASVVVDHVFDARSSLSFWEKAKKHRVNTLWMAPTVLSILLRMDRGRTGEEFCRASVRHTFVGFAPLSLKVTRQFETRYGVQLIENYGLSETLFVTARSTNFTASQGYVGEALPGVSLRIVDDEGSPNTDTAGEENQEGEIQILTPDLMAGYLDTSGNLQKVDSSTWFATGDVGRLDDRGSLSITGRKKDLIIRGGVNISPAAIEESLVQVAGVADAAVVSIPHELYGEDIVAVLKLDAGLELESILDTLVNHSRLHLALHQQPARYISIDEFPRTANGKVQKSRLRDLVSEKFQTTSTSTSTPRSPAEESVAVSSTH